MKQYDKGPDQFGIIAEAGKMTRKSFEVVKYEAEKLVMVTPMIGQTLEVQHTGKWQEGAIREIITESRIKWTLKSDPSVQGEATWPPDKTTIAPCGTHIANITCNDGSGGSIKINFGPERKTFTGFLQDTGESYRDHDGVF